MYDLCPTRFGYWYSSCNDRQRGFSGFTRYMEVCSRYICEGRLRCTSTWSDRNSFNEPYTCVEPAPAPPAAPRCDIFMDLVLVIDQSGSMWRFKNDVKRFGHTMAQQFRLGRHGSRIGVVYFSTNAQIAQPLTYSDADVRASIDAYTPNGYTSISSGLSLASEQLLQTPRCHATEPDCTDATHSIIMVLTDGEQSSHLGGRQAAVQAANAAKAPTAAGRHTKIFAVGFGGSQQATLDGIASSPSSEYSYLASDLDDVIWQFSDLCTRVASPRMPPPPPSPPLVPSP